MLVENLKKIIPKELDEFPKINLIGSPYFFSSWDIDNKSKEPILRYWFWNKEKNYSNPKRLFLNEFETLIKNSLETGNLLRSDYNRLCLRTYSDGTCGFAVIVAILNHLELIREIAPGNYIIIDSTKIRNFLK